MAPPAVPAKVPLALAPSGNRGDPVLEEPPNRNLAVVEAASKLPAGDRPSPRGHLEDMAASRLPAPGSYGGQCGPMGCDSTSRVTWADV
jgi:hypothetical protein